VNNSGQPDVTNDVRLVQPEILRLYREAGKGEWAEEALEAKNLGAIRYL
jgi:hypothetical protein